MRKLYLLLFSGFTFFSFSQTTTIPDPNFEQALIDLGYDTTIDGFVSTATIETITGLNVTRKFISDLTGIEDFTALTDLSCGSNQLTSLDVSNNLALERLFCSYNQLTSLDLSTNTALNSLSCANNQLTSLDLSTNTALNSLSCANNRLKSLDVRNGNNDNFVSFFSSMNPLRCILVDSEAYSTVNWTGKDTFSTFVNNEAECVLDSSTTIIPDPDFEQALIDLGYDTTIDGFVSTAIIETITSLDVSRKYIGSLSGIEDFIALTELTCSNNGLSSLDVSANIALTSLDCSSNYLKSLDLSTNTALTSLDCSNYVIRFDHVPVYGNNRIKSLDLSTNTALTSLKYSRNYLTSLDVSTNTALTVLDCRDNQLTSLDVSTNTALIYLNCSANQLTSLDVRNGNNASFVSFHSRANLLACILVDDAAYSTVNWTDKDAVSTFGNNEGECVVLDSRTTAIPDPNYEQALIDLGYDTTIDGFVSTAIIEAITSLSMYNKNITDLTGIADFTALTELSCIANQLTSLDVSTNTALTSLNCRDNQLTSLDVSNATALTNLNCSANQLTSLDVRNGNNASFVSFDSTDNLLACIFVDDAAYSTVNWTSKDAVSTFVNNEAECVLDSRTTAIPDPNFEQALIDLGYDITIDGFVSTAIIEAITSLDVSGKFGISTNGVPGLPGIEDLTGIEDFTALTDFNCSNNKFSSLDVSNNTALTSLSCSSNELTSLDLSTNTALTYLNCSYSLLTTLDVSNNLALKDLVCKSNRQLTSLDLSANTALTALTCINNQLTSLDVSSNTALTYLDCSNSGLTSLDLSANTALTELNVRNNRDWGVHYDIENQLTSLDVSNNTALTDFNCENNQFTSLDLSANTDLTSLSCYSNQLTSLDLSANTALTYLSCATNQLTSLDLRNGNNANISRAIGYSGLILHNNPSLTCVFVDSAAYMTEFFYIDAVSTFVNNEAECDALISRTMTIPSPSFEQALIDLGYDQTLDGSILAVVVESITSLNVSNKNITDLTGIQNFTRLINLECSSNQLTSLDVTANTALTTLDCSGNQLTSLDVSNNTALTYLNCPRNQLTSLDVSNNTALIYFSCYSNQLTSLDVSTNTALTGFLCIGNQLTSLDVRNGNNANDDIYRTFDSRNNPNLTCILVDASDYSTVNWTKKDATSTFVNNEAECEALSLVEISDPNFEQVLIDLGYDTSIDGYIPAATIEAITSLDLSNKNITNLTAIKYFTALTHLSCSGNQLTSLDLSANTALTELNCSDNQLTSLDLPTNIDLSFEDNRLTSLDASANTALTYLNCSNNQLTSLDVRNGNNTALGYFNSANNPDLSCITVDAADYSTANWTNKDATSKFVNNEAECEALSVADNPFELGISVYPNPTANYLFITGNKTPISVSIYNLLGKKLISAKNINKVDVKELSNGVYIIIISNGTNQTSRRFIKN